MSSGDGKGGKEYERYKSHVDELVHKVEELALTKGTTHQNDKEWHGTTGKRVRLITNYYGMRLAQRQICSYRVMITSGRDHRPCIHRKLCRKYFWYAVGYVDAQPSVFINKFQLVYDDRELLFSAQPLRNYSDGKEIQEGSTLELPFEYRESAEERGIPVVLCITRTRTFSIGPVLQQIGLHFLNLLVSQPARCPISQAISNHWYSETSSMYRIPVDGLYEPYDITPCSQLLKGIRCSVLLNDAGLPSLNVDLANSVFAKVNLLLIDFYVEVLEERGPLTEEQREQLAYMSMSQQQAAKLESHLKGFQLRATYGTQATYKFHSIDRRCPGEFRFEHSQFGVITVQEYCLRNFGLRLRYPNLPLIHMCPPQRNIYIPMELLKISDQYQRIVRRLQPNLLAKVVKKSTHSPNEHFGKIDYLVKDAKALRNTTAQTFGVEFGQNQITVEGRQLAKPECTFTLDARHLLDNIVPPNGTVVYALVEVSPFSFRDRNNLNAISNMVRECKNCGINFAQANSWAPPFMWNPEAEPFLQLLEKVSQSLPQMYRSSEIQKILFIGVAGENKASEHYGAIKSYCEISGADFGVISQVLQGVTMAKIGGQPPNRNVLKNVILKINAKLGGTNNRISQESDRFGDKLQSWSKFTNPREPTLWIGVDVTHPSKDESGLESIAAVASNLDIHATQFRGSWALQEGNNIEQVRELQRLVFDAVEKFFEANNRKLPHHLVIVRDGLSNSQMVQFGAYEMSKIGAACKEVAQKSGLTFTPTITYIVVQKRHGTRFLLSDNQENMEGSDPYYGRYNGNVRPGTVVDNTVTGNVYPNFFLCSHKGQLGTSRPAHYTILHNNWNLEMNDWQEAMFLLCHLIARSITPVSIPVPVYYAHLLCSRVRKYILAVKDEEGPAYRMDMIQIHASIQGQQFFI